MNKVRICISGRVQGVGYRQSAQQMAQSLNLNGWVKNMSDGSVMVEALGSSAGIESFVTWCKLGPSSAKVERVELTFLGESDQKESSPANSLSGTQMARGQTARFTIIG